MLTMVPQTGDTVKDSKDRVPFFTSTMRDTNKKIIGACSAVAKCYTEKKHNGQFSLNKKRHVTHSKWGKDKCPWENSKLKHKEEQWLVKHEVGKKEGGISMKSQHGLKAQSQVKFVWNKAIKAKHTQKELWAKRLDWLTGVKSHSTLLNHT